MKLVITLLICLINSDSFAQKIYQDKQASIDAIRNVGSIITSNNEGNLFYYRRYDENGEAKVIYTAEGSNIRKVSFICEDEKQAVKRALEAFKSTRSYQADQDIIGVFIAIGTIYYDGKARYSTINNRLEIIVLDPPSDNPYTKIPEYSGEINVVTNAPILDKPDMIHSNKIGSATAGKVTILRKENEKFYYVRSGSIAGYLWIGWIKQ